VRRMGGRARQLGVRGTGDGRRAGCRAQRGALHAALAQPRLTASQLDGKADHARKHVRGGKRAHGLRARAGGAVCAAARAGPFPSVRAGGVSRLARLRLHLRCLPIQVAVVDHGAHQPGEAAQGATWRRHSLSKWLLQVQGLQVKGYRTRRERSREATSGSCAGAMGHRHRTRDGVQSRGPRVTGAWGPACGGPGTGTASRRSAASVDEASSSAPAAKSDSPSPTRLPQAVYMQPTKLLFPNLPQLLTLPSYRDGGSVMPCGQ
jgi:hypothetical protein